MLSVCHRSDVRGLPPGKRVLSMNANGLRHAVRRFRKRIGKATAVARLGGRNLCRLARGCERSAWKLGAKNNNRGQKDHAGDG